MTELKQRWHKESRGAKFAMNNDFVQYGCGLSAPDSWRNFDASPTLWLQRAPIISILGKQLKPRFANNIEYGDVTSRLPVPEGSCRMVYCSHVLEHLALEDFRAALAETYRILKPGGVFRLVVPDLSLMVERYSKNPDAGAAPRLMRETILGHETSPKTLLETIRAAFGNSAHKWMWDYASLSKELADVGFENIRRAQFSDNPEPKLADVESIERWSGCLGIECAKIARDKGKDG